MIQRAGYDLLRVGLRLALKLWPLWLVWYAWYFAWACWRDYLISIPDQSSMGYALLTILWPTVGLLGPFALMLAAIAVYSGGLAGRTMPSLVSPEWW